jgi:beta-lactamase regulating signal transducer with metallopeptidase domain
MIPASVLLLLAKATVVLVAALGITRVLQRASAGARHVVWLATLGALLLVPAVAAWGPIRLAILPAMSASPRTATSDVAAPPARGPALAVTTPAGALVLTGPRDASSGQAGPPTPAAVDRPGFAGAGLTDVVPVALALWAAVAAALGGTLAASWLAVRRIVRRARPLDAPDWRDPLWEVADRLGLDEPPRLLCSDHARMPFACGLAHPTVVLPAGCDAWTPDRRRAVLLHELAHVRRRDLAGHTLARLVCAVYWFHPLVWTAARRLRAESERACDDLALASGARAADYAEHLLDIVTAVRRDTTPRVALAMARRTEFEGRMLDILDPERPRAAPGRWQRASLVGVLALITVIVGAAAPAPAAGPGDAAPSDDVTAPRRRAR